MGFDLNQFLANGLVFGGARPSKFDIQATLPASVAFDPTSIQKLQFTAKAASLPAFNLGAVQIPYFGRKIKSSGDRVWDDWQITVMLDEDYNTRAMFEAWNNGINALEQNIMNANWETGNVLSSAGVSSETEGYKTNWNITHYAKDGTNDVIRQYTLIGAWPRVIGPINLDWDATDRIVEFQVMVSYDWLLPTIEGAKGNQTSYASAA